MTCADHYRSILSALRRLDPQKARDVFHRIRAESLEQGLWSEVEGRAVPLSLAVRPCVLSREQVGYLHSTCRTLRQALLMVAALNHSTPEIRSLLSIGEEEAAHLSRLQANRSKERFLCRLDALSPLGTSRWRADLKFVETNVVGVGGMTYAPVAGQILLKLLEDMMPRLECVELPDPRMLLFSELAEQALDLGLSGLPRVALVDDQTAYRLGGEMGRLARFLTLQGMRAKAVDVRELEEDAHGNLVHGEFTADLVFRFLEMRELVAIDRTTSLRPLWNAFRGGRVLPTAGADLDHKSVFEVFTRSDLANRFPAGHREVFRRHVLWTRLLYERKTQNFAGELVDLFPYVERHQEQLVIKPNRGYGGIKVHLGSILSRSQWREALQVAASEPGRYVVQELTQPVYEDVPTLEECGRLNMEERFLSLGFFPTAHSVGALGRFSRGAVVNISQEGGVIPLVSETL